MRRMVFLDESVSVVFHAALVGSLWLLFAGHNQPGGGFAGGLVAGAAISLRYLAGGLAEVRRVSRFAPWTILGTGLATSTGIALVPVLIGEPILSSLGTELDLPLLGASYASTALVFDIGVYMLVVGLVFMVFEAFGDETVDLSEASAPGDDGEAAS